MRIGLPSAPSASSLEGIGVLAAELEDVADLDAARRDERCPDRPGDGSPSRTSAASMVPSGVKSRPAHQADDVVVGFVRAGDPRGARDHPRVDQVPHAVGLQAPRGRCSP